MPTNRTDYLTHTEIKLSRKLTKKEIRLADKARKLNMNPHEFASALRAQEVKDEYVLRRIAAAMDDVKEIEHRYELGRSMTPAEQHRRIERAIRRLTEAKIQIDI